MPLHSEKLDDAEYRHLLLYARERRHFIRRAADAWVVEHNHREVFRGRVDAVRQYLRGIAPDEEALRRMRGMLYAKCKLHTPPLRFDEIAPATPDNLAEYGIALGAGRDGKGGHVSIVQCEGTFTVCAEFLNYA
jgi:crotonobetainyl-CoA:carnitine CoA-transferase CaiB-like acyl-CoA transferase